MIRFGHIEIFVSDPMTSKSFYERILGFRVVDVQDEQYVWLNSDGTHILLRPGVPGSAPESYSSSKVGHVIYTDDLDSTMSLLRSRGLQFSGNDGSERCPTFKDPDGNWFQLVNPNDH